MKAILFSRQNHAKRPGRKSDQIKEGKDRKEIMGTLSNAMSQPLYLIDILTDIYLISLVI